MPVGWDNKTKTRNPSHHGQNQDFEEYWDDYWAAPRNEQEHKHVQRVAKQSESTYVPDHNAKRTNEIVGWILKKTEFIT